MGAVWGIMGGIGGILGTPDVGRYAFWYVGTWGCIDIGTPGWVWYGT